MLSIFLAHFWADFPIAEGGVQNAAEKSAAEKRLFVPKNSRNFKEERDAILSMQNRETMQKPFFGAVFGLMSLLQKARSRTLQKNHPQKNDFSFQKTLEE